MNDRALITKNYLGLVINCLEKEGYWYKGQCWQGFEEHGITTQNIDSVYGQ